MDFFCPAPPLLHIPPPRKKSVPSTSYYAWRGEKRGGVAGSERPLLTPRWIWEEGIDWLPRGQPGGEGPPWLFFEKCQKISGGWGKRRMPILRPHPSPPHRSIAVPPFWKSLFVPLYILYWKAFCLVVRNVLLYQSYHMCCVKCQESLLLNE